MANSKRTIDIRALTTPAEMRAAVALQKSIWGFEDFELLPVRLFVVATKIGGQVFGAYDSAELVAFCLAIPGIKAGLHPYLHSHMLGVAPEYRNLGLGRMLKTRQREDALLRDITLMEWTFDPLELKNAYFNIERLGAIVRRFTRNQYGATTSHLHAGLPTDRCTAEWHLASARVTGFLDGAPPPSPPTEVRIEVPTDLKLARASQSRISDEFDELLGTGLAVTGFERSERFGTYLLTKWE
ncbi:MAG: acetyltransferase [Acidobacteriota bacterium]|nr:acetyltransferase [Acidobacteriota bacterium]